jgi:L-aspartate oxidase
MWRHAGLLRQRASLEDAVARLEAWAGAVRRVASERHLDHDFRRVHSLVIVGLLIAKAALRRQESRGGHFRTDFPSHDDLHWKKHVSDIVHG